MIHLYKKNGDRAPCDYHRGILLLSIAGTIMAHMKENALGTEVGITHQLLDDVSESQCGFSRN